MFKSGTNWDGILLGNTRLNTTSATILADAIENSATLTKLDLSRNRDIDTEGWIAIANCLKTLSGLEVLDIGDNDMDDESAIRIANELTVRSLEQVHR